MEINVCVIEIMKCLNNFLKAITKKAIKIRIVSTDKFAIFNATVAIRNSLLLVHKTIGRLPCLLD